MRPKLWAVVALASRPNCSNIRRFEYDYYKIRAERACKPGSVEDDHSSRRTVTNALKQPTRIRRGPRHGCLFGLASDGVCRTGPLPDSRCALTAPFHPCHAPEGRSAVYSLLHFPSARAAQPLAGILPCEARTFLPHVSHEDLDGSDRPACSAARSVADRERGR